MEPLLYLIPPALLAVGFGYMQLRRRKVGAAVGRAMATPASEAQQIKFGLREGEQVHAIHLGCFRFDEAPAHPTTQLVGADASGSAFRLGYSNQRRLLIGHEAPNQTPVAFEQGSVKVSDSPLTPTHEFLANARGQQQPARVVALGAMHGTVHIEVPSGLAENLKHWAMGGSVSTPFG